MGSVIVADVAAIEDVGEREAESFLSLADRRLPWMRLELAQSSPRAESSRAGLGENYLAVVKRHVRVPAEHHTETIAMRFLCEVFIGNSGVLCDPILCGPLTECGP